MFKSIAEAFEKVFYKDTLTLYTKNRKGSYDVAETKKVLCDVKADIQPYSGGLAREEYGLSMNEGLKVFCPVFVMDDSAAVYTEIGGAEYLVMHRESWDLGNILILGRVKA